MILLAAAWAHDLQPGVLALREIAPGRRAACLLISGAAAEPAHAVAAA